MKMPPANDGAKVVLLDTDHLWGIGGDAAWVWRAFLNGHQPLYMDPLDADDEREGARRAMGVARRLADRLGLETLEPRPELVNSKCCLATIGEPHATMVAWASRGRLNLDLGRWHASELDGEWLHPTQGTTVGLQVRANAKRVPLRAPWRGDAVVVLRQTPRRGEIGRSRPSNTPSTNQLDDR